jgi:hypothetical protein
VEVDAPQPGEILDDFLLLGPGVQWENLPKITATYNLKGFKLRQFHIFVQGELEDDSRAVVEVQELQGPKRRVVAIGLTF